MNEIQWAFLGGIATTLLIILMCIIVLFMKKVWQEIQVDLQADKIKRLEHHMVATLRDQTGAPMRVCKSVLIHNNWNMEKAREEICTL